MKKILLLSFGLLLVSGVFAAGNEMSFRANFGIMTDDSFSFNPIMWTVGAELDFQLGDYLMFSPEVILVGFKFEFREFLLIPGAILNFTLGNFFVGGGVNKSFYMGSGPSESSDFELKLNAGLITKSIKFTAYVISSFDTLFKNMGVGASLGYRF